MIATLLPSPTLLSMIADARRGAQEAYELGKEKFRAKLPRTTPGEVAIKVAQAVGRLSVKATVPLVIRDAIAIRAAKLSAAAGLASEPSAAAVQPQPTPEPVTEAFVWQRTVAPILEAQTGARSAVTLHSSAGAHIDAATYALDGMLADLKAVMPGINMRSAKLHRLEFPAQREAAAQDAPRARPALRTFRAA